MIRFKKNVFILLLGFFTSYCGGHSGGGDAGTNTSSAVLNFANKKQVAIPVSLNLGAVPSKAALGALGLVSPNAASSYSMSLAGCASGQTATITDPNVKVYPGDTGCLVKLTTFVFNGNTYIPKTGAGFSTWLIGDLATFANSSSSTDIYIVKVISQLTQGGILPNDAVSYTFYQVDSGVTQSVNSNTLIASQSISVSGQEAPNFVFSTNGSPASTGTVAPVVFKGLSNGIGQFVLNLYCNQAMGTSGSCGSIPLTSITYKLIGDTYGVHTGTNLSLSDLQNIISSGTSSINTSTDLLTDNNKGFSTSILAGPGAISSNPYMIFVVSGGISYKYFLIQLSSATNN